MSAHEKSMRPVSKLPEVGTKEWGDLVENEFALVETSKRSTSSYEEIMTALAWYFGDDGYYASAESIYEIINQEHDPIETIAKALDDYREQ
ncbi:TPA: hypothetical protein MCM29_005164 [Klebsiella pneumoniae]|nr:hypothetical protein [Klebsiella pneumoniae]